MAVDDEVLVHAHLELAHPRLHDRLVLQGREAQRQVVAGALHLVGRDQPFVGVGIEGGLLSDRAHLEAAIVDAGEAVVAQRVVLGVVGEVGVAEAVVARGRSEEEHVAARGEELHPHHLREDLAQPGPAGEDEGRGGDRGAVGERDVGEPRACLAAEARAADPEASALLLEGLGDRHASFARLQHAGRGLEERDADPFGIHLRVATSKLALREPLVGNPVLVERGLRGLQAVVPVGREEQPSRLVEEAPSPFGLPSLPAAEGLEHPPRVQLAVLVAGADLARLASGAGPRVAGTVGVDQRHRRAHLPQREGRPSAEGARADDHDVAARLGARPRRQREQGGLRPRELEKRAPVHGGSFSGSAIHRRALPRASAV